MDIHEKTRIVHETDLEFTMYQQCGAMVFVIDAQVFLSNEDDFLDALLRLYSTAYKLNPAISFEVFIHKVDGLSDDHKIDIQREVHQRLTDNCRMRDWITYTWAFT